MIRKDPSKWVFWVAILLVVFGTVFLYWMENKSGWLG